MITGTVFVIVLAAALGMALLLADRWLASDAGQQDEAGIAEIERLLPRIQCGQCGFPGCRAYAQALFERRADINRCPPGGVATLRRLARALAQVGPPPLDTSLGQASLEHVARIDEARCIGCNLCQPACPVDAIVGLPQMMHTVLAAHCTGCELCVPLCPVDCIDLVPRHG
jgi:RnfABCDGE-type electron transport complex B subunit